ncbi:hypothetical protein OHR68_37540 [Spirillospora sp. NBC_00431]
MSNLWRCYSWQGPADAPTDMAEPVENWTSPEGAVEFLRRELSAHGLYSKSVLVSALADLRKGERVKLSRELDGRSLLHLVVVPEAA